MVNIQMKIKQFNILYPKGYHEKLLEKDRFKREISIFEAISSIFYYFILPVYCIVLFL